MVDNNDDSSDTKNGLIGEAIKKVFTVGMGAAFLTEESIRNYLGELKLPKEFLNMLLQGASKSKEEMMKKVGNEIATVVSKLDLAKEATEFLQTHSVKITAEIDFTKKK